MNNAEVKAASFTLDMSNEIYKGYHDPSEDWNGWAVPYFTKEVGAKIIADLLAYDSKKHPYYTGTRWDEKNEVFIIVSDGEPEIIRPEKMMLKSGEALMLYPFGMGWCWSVFP